LYKKIVMRLNQRGIEAYPSDNHPIMNHVCPSPEMPPPVTILSSPKDQGISPETKQEKLH
jgi:hypothetical protein